MVFRYFCESTNGIKFNFVDGQFLTKRNSKAKWLEHCLDSLYYGRIFLPDQFTSSGETDMVHHFFLVPNTGLLTRNPCLLIKGHLREYLLFGTPNCCDSQTMQTSLTLSMSPFVCSHLESSNTPTVKYTLSKQQSHHFASEFLSIKKMSLNKIRDLIPILL